MFEPLHCVALRTIRYSDSNSILTVYSRERGRLALYVPAGNGRSASRYRALTQPMSVFECVAEIKGGREIHRFKDIKADDGCLQGAVADPVRSVLSLFLADFFASVLKEPLPDEAMFELLRTASRNIAGLPSSRLSNLHIATLVTALRILGIEPDTSTVGEGRFFDMGEGLWTDNIADYNRYCLSLEESAFVALLARMTHSNQHLFRFSRQQRNDIVEGILKYFSLHGFGKLELASLPVLRELFD